MRRRALLHSLLLPTLLLAPGCARQDGEFPSLARRPAEARGFAEPIAPAPPPVMPDPALDARLKDLSARLDETQRAFGTGEARAAAAGNRARGARAGSEAWIAAQAALADLDSARADTSAVVTEADQLGIDRTAAASPDSPALNALQARGRDELARQEGAIARLGDALAPAR